MEKFIGVSACLVGENCRYDGRNCLNKKVVDFLKNKNLVRVPSEIKDGSGKDVLEGKSKVINREGEDMTEYYIKGAEITLKILKLNKADFVIFKQLSPSCGKGKIYDGSFTNKIIEGNGVTTQLLLENGINVITEEDL